MNKEQSIPFKTAVTLTTLPQEDYDHGLHSKILQVGIKIHNGFNAGIQPGILLLTGNGQVSVHGAAERECANTNNFQSAEHRQGQLLELTLILVSVLPLCYCCSM